MIVWKDRVRAALIHLGISLAIAALAAALVFLLWYPYPYREISGGRELFLLVMAVDVVLGPLLTLAVFNRAKPRAELRRDLGVIGLLQLLALLYGLWTVFVARPVHLVFEYDRFRVIHAIDVAPELLAQKPPHIQALPLWGPTLLALRPLEGSAEQLHYSVAALGGLALAAQPALWQDYPEALARVRQAGRPLAQLRTRFAARSGEIEAWLAPHLAARGGDAATLLTLPLAGRKSFWTVLLDARSGLPIAYLPLDSF